MDSTLVIIAVVGAVQAIAIVALPLWFKNRSDRNREEDKADRAEVAHKVEGTQATLNQVHTELGEVHSATNTNYREMVKELAATREGQAVTRQELAAAREEIKSLTVLLAKANEAP